MLVYNSSLNRSKNHFPLEYAILVDCREKNIIPHIEPPFNVKQIQCGDFQVWCKFPDSTGGQSGREIPVIVIERKTWKDLAASIVDGRADSQHERMQRFRVETGALVYYMIEGPVFQNPEKPIGHRAKLTFSSLVKRLDHWTQQGGIAVVHTKDPADTGRRIMELVRNFSDKYSNHFQPTAVLVPDIGCRELEQVPMGTRVIATVPTGVSRQWTSIMSPRIANALSSKYRLDEVLSMDATNMYEEELLCFLRLSGCLRCGRKTVQNILRPDTEKFLASIVGISKARAKGIAAKFPECLREIARGNSRVLEEINGGLEGFCPNKTIGEKIKKAICSVDFRENLDIS